MGGDQKMTTHFFGSKIMNLLVFSVLSQNSVFGSRLLGVCMGRSGMSAFAMYALFSHFCHAGVFRSLGDPMLPTFRGVSGNDVTAYAY